MVIDCGGTLRCGLYPKREFPPLTCIPPVKAARWRNLYEGIYVSGVTPACIEMVWPQGKAESLGSWLTI